MEPDQDRYRCLVENAPYCIHELDPDGRVLSMNAAGLRMLGCFDVADVSGLPYLDVVGAEDRPRVTRLMQEALAGEARHFEYEGASGKYYRSNFIPIRDETGAVRRLMGITQDLTEQRRAALALRASEEQLHHARKMEAVGRVAGGIAHDFNNLLMVIQANAELLRKRLRDDPESRELSDELREAAERAASLVRQLLTFSRRSRIVERSVSLHAIVDEVVQHLRRLDDTGVRVHTDLGPQEAIVLGDAGQLHSAVLNLALNAREAMPGGGELRFTSSRVCLSEEECRELREDLAPGEFVRLEIADNGIGIPADVLPHVFEPFFTTKSHGTGLGLATAYAVVVNHHGAVRVSSEPNVGTRFTLWLPVAIKLPGEDGTAPEPFEHGRGHFLVVDDDRAVRRVVTRALHACGYTTCEAENGVEAVRVIETGGDPLDAVVLDMVMPQLDGLETLREIRKRRTELPVLILTGYAQDDTVRALLEEGAAGVLTKPVELHELTAALKRIRSRAPAGRS